MATYNTTPINQLPVGTIVKATDIYPAVDVTDMTESPTGTCKQYTVAELADFIGEQSLPYNTVQIFVSQVVGNDLNSGSYSDPLATIGAALTKASTTTVALTIVILDGATYNEQIVVNNPLINFYAPLAILSYTGGGDAVTYNFCQYNSFTFYIVQCSTGNAFVNNSSSGGIGINVLAFAEGNIVNNGASEIFINSDFINATINGAGSGPVTYSTQRRFGVDTGNVNGTTSTGTLENWSIAGTLTASGNQYPIGTSTNGYVMTQTSPGVLQLVPNAPSIPYNGFQLYVSQQIGSDITGTGSLTNPLASIGAAITLAGSPPAGMPVIITVMDGDTYNEQVTVNVENIYISMPFAQLNFSGVGDTLTIGSAAKLLIIAAAVQNSGTGNAITNIGGSLFGQIEVLQSGTVALEQTGAGGISFLTSGQAIVGDITNPGVGTIFYSTNLRTGTDASGVVGITPQGCSTNWNVGTNLTFSDTINGIVGTVSGDNANAGIVGEYMYNNNSVALTSNTDANVATITLSPGDWDVEANCFFDSAVTTIVTGAEVSVSLVSGVEGTAGMTAFANWNGNAVLNAQPVLSTGNQRINVTVSTPVYAVCRSTFSVSTMTAAGYIRARRVR